ncbi:hypothetical protein ACHAWF_015493 [Thalassiosira exigua]
MANGKGNTPTPGSRHSKRVEQLRKEEEEKAAKLRLEEAEEKAEKEKEEALKREADKKARAEQRRREEEEEKRKADEAAKAAKEAEEKERAAKEAAAKAAREVPNPDINDFLNQAQTGSGGNEGTEGEDEAMGGRQRRIRRGTRSACPRRRRRSATKRRGSARSAKLGSVAAATAAARHYQPVATDHTPNFHHVVVSYLSRVLPLARARSSSPFGASGAAFPPSLRARTPPLRISLRSASPLAASAFPPSSSGGGERGYASLAGLRRGDGFGEGRLGGPSPAG